jgi:DNA modification methylase
MTKLEQYRDFLRRKAVVTPDRGFAVDIAEFNPILKPHQKVIAQWGCAGGCRAIFAKFGLGKSMMQLEIVRVTLLRTGGRGLITAPLGVRVEFMRDAAKLGIKLTFIRRIEEAGPTGIYLTNFETVRDGKLDPGAFQVCSLDEASVLRGFGGSKTFREFMRLYESVPYKFVATAIPDPNDHIELLAYAAFLGVMDVGQAKTRFFKRDATKADVLMIHPHKEREFWLWVSSWAIFLQKPSDLGFSDEGYDLPPMDVRYHEVAVDHRNAPVETNGQKTFFRGSVKGVVEASREKRDTLDLRVAKMQEIMAASPEDHFLLWHDLEAERRAIEDELIEQYVEKAKSGSQDDPLPKRWASVYGTQDLDEREQAIIDFSDGKIQHLAAKPVIAGSGCNFQRFCHREIFVGIGFKFNDFIQAIHRTYRFLQSETVVIDVIYAESEREVLRNLQTKWAQYEETVQKMSEIIREYGLDHAAKMQELIRSMGVERAEVSGENYRLIHNDCVEEAMQMPANSIDMVLTSIPFSTQYEYTPSYNDFGHSDDNEHFFAQMDFLTPELYRILEPGRIAAIHVKDRIVPGGMTGLGFQTVYPFHMRVTEHFLKHGFAYMGMKTIVTDVVRENNQTYRLGWTEQCKDGTKMGVGMPEYLLLFRKPPSENVNSYADVPVVKEKRGYSRARWQTDAHGFARSSGQRLLMPEELDHLDHQAIFKLFRDYNLEHVYDFEHHVRIGEALEAKRILPVTFMLLQTPSWSPDVWTDVTRMQTLNGAQHAKGREMHLCPMQFDIADRAIEQFTMEGETVFDPFGGLMTTAYRALKLKRKAVCTELNLRYFLDGCTYAKAMEEKVSMPTLFDTLEAEAEIVDAPAEVGAA